MNKVADRIILVIALLVISGMAMLAIHVDGLNAIKHAQHLKTLKIQNII